MLHSSYPRAALLVSTVIVAVIVSCARASDLQRVDLPSPNDGGSPEQLIGDSEISCSRCSPDNRTVVDCDNHFVETCPSDRSCLDGACVSACQAADATHSSVGCEYYAVPPSGFYDYRGSCYAVLIANTSSTPASILVDRDGHDFDTTTFMYATSGSGSQLAYAPLSSGEIPPGELAVLFLAQASTPEPFVPCPASVTTAEIVDPAVHGTGTGNAYHIRSSAPVVSYDIYPYGGARSAITSATLLLPTSVWGTNYMSVTAYPGIDGGILNPWLSIVALEDSTSVTISPVVDIQGGNGVASTAKGAPHTYSLQRGEYVQLEQPAELTGSPILSDKPVGLWGGQTCMFVLNPYCDSAHQQLPPVKALGHEYPAARFRDRREGVRELALWRVVGVVDDTTLTYMPDKPLHAPTTLMSGQLAGFLADGPFVIASQDAQHPFYLASYMTGCMTYSGSSSDCPGDAEFVNVIPSAQYSDHYTFLADPTYPDTNLVIIRTKVDGVFADVTLDCAGVVGNWQQLGDYEWTRLDLVRDGIPQSGCDNGRHLMYSSAPFGLVVWGWANVTSYGYPAGADVRSLSNTVVQPVPK